MINFKILLLVLIAFTASNVSAKRKASLSTYKITKKGDSFVMNCPAIVRKKSGRAKEEIIQIKDLISKDSFTGKYFKIVQAESEDGIKIPQNLAEVSDDKKQLLLKACTVYFHMSKARVFFKRQLSSQYVSQLSQMTVRLDISRTFNEFAHYANVNMAKEYNNALSIPAGDGYEPLGIKPWNKEVWFRPSKKIHISEIPGVTDATASYKQILRSFRQQIHMQTLQRFLIDLSTGSVSDSNYGVENVLRLVGASVVMEFGYQMMGPLAKLFSRKWFHLESALVPEIIYHEYAHIALSDEVPLTYSGPVNEGIADYFAGAIANNHKLALKIKKYNTFNGKNAKRKQEYQEQFETSEWANTDYVFGLLWGLQDLYGKEDAHCFIHRIRKNLEPSSTIRGNLVDAILGEIDHIKKVKVLRSQQNLTAEEQKIVDLDTKECQLVRFDTNGLNNRIRTLRYIDRRGL